MNTYQEPFDRQREYVRSDITLPAAWRIDQLDRLERLVTENAVAFKQALASDFKTASFEQDMEIGGALGAVRAAREHVADWMQPDHVELPQALTSTGHHAEVRRVPFGVALLIAPFNAPLALLVDPLVAILAAGNTAIVKPSEATSAVSELFARLFAAYFEPEVVTVVRGGRTVVAELLELPFDVIFFTGSTNVGKVVMRAAAEHLTPVVLELGGQNPAVVDETADLADAARKLLWGATAFAGQWCVSPGYVYVHESVAGQFLDELRAAAKEFWGDDPKSSPDFSRIISTRDTERLAALIDPAKVIVGGEHDVAARYVAPTVVYPATRDDLVMQAEIFGPILPVLPYSDLDEVVAVVKNQPKPLAGYIFSRDEWRIERLLTMLPFGGACVNQTMLQVMFDALPFGGVGSSGLGRYYGKAGFDSLSQAKSVVHSVPGVALEVLLPPYDADSPARLATLLAS